MKLIQNKINIIKSNIKNYKDEKTISSLVNQNINNFIMFLLLLTLIIFFFWYFDNLDFIFPQNTFCEEIPKLHLEEINNNNSSLDEEIINDQKNSNNWNYKKVALITICTISAIALIYYIATMDVDILNYPLPYIKETSATKSSEIAKSAYEVAMDQKTAIVIENIKTGVEGNSSLIGKTYTDIVLKRLDNLYDFKKDIYSLVDCEKIDFISNFKSKYSVTSLTDSPFKLVNNNIEFARLIDFTNSIIVDTYKVGEVMLDKIPDFSSIVHIVSTATLFKSSSNLLTKINGKQSTGTDTTVATSPTTGVEENLEEIATTIVKNGSNGLTKTVDLYKHNYDALRETAALFYQNGPESLTKTAASYRSVLHNHFGNNESVFELKQNFFIEYFKNQQTGLIDIIGHSYVPFKEYYLNVAKTYGTLLNENLLNLSDIILPAKVCDYFFKIDELIFIQLHDSALGNMKHQLFYSLPNINLFEELPSLIAFCHYPGHDFFQILLKNEFINFVIENNLFIV